MTVDEAEAIIARFGGTSLTVGTFTKMIGAGAGKGGRSSGQSKELDENEKWVMHIARQAKGKKWEDVLRQGGGNLEMVCNVFKKMGIFIMATDLKPVVAKYGVEGLIDKVIEFMDRV
jgi:hypothetical protein